METGVKRMLGEQEGVVYGMRPGRPGRPALWLCVLGSSSAALLVALLTVSFLLATCAEPAPVSSMLTTPQEAGVPEEDSDSDLELLHLIWRHGNRAPVPITYPTDPYLNATYEPFGRGGLTKPGYGASYELGRFLRQHYDGFLGRTLTRKLVQLRSSDVRRTRDSAALVMAGLFPPEPAQRWGAGLGDIWLPFTPDVLSLQDDGICGGMDCWCPALVAETKRVKGLPELADLERKVLNGTDDFMSYVERQSGLNLTGSRTPLKGVWDAFSGQTDMGMPIPEWGKAIYPEPLKTVIGHVFHTDVFSDLQKRLTAGALLHEIIETSLNHTSASGRRLFAYSSHDHVLMAVLGALGAVQPLHPEHPPYAAVIALELRRSRASGQRGLKILYRDGGSRPMRLLSVPGCGPLPLCPLSRVSELLSAFTLPLEQQRRECLT